MATKTKKRRPVRKKNRALPAWVMPVGICLLALVVLALGPGFKVRSAQELPEYAFLTAHEYDWDRLSVDETGRMSYMAQTGAPVKTGIDVSSHQGVIDWEKVAADGVDFAFIRVGSRGYQSGEIYPDERFEENFTGAKKQRLAVGVYFYSQAISEKEAKEEARTVLKALDGRSCGLPVVIDFEDVFDADVRTASLTRAERTAIIKAFCDTVYEAGYDPMLYSYRSMLQNAFDLTALPQVGIWLAEYKDRPDYDYSFSVWQYTSEAVVDGIEKPVDMNLYLADWPC